MPPLSASLTPPVITWDCPSSPSAQKSRDLLSACRIPYQSCVQPSLLPRPTLTSLGISSLRLPITSIGKDLYCDNRIFLSAVQAIFPEHALPTNPADHAYEALGYRSFWIALQLVPAELVTEEMARKGDDLFAVFNRADFRELRPNALVEFRSLLDILATECLVPGPWIGGSTCSVADIHAVWVVKWAFQKLELGSEPGFSKEDFPKIYAWIEGLPAHSEENHPEEISPEEAKEKILNSEYAAVEIGVDPDDPTGLTNGAIVNVASNDDAKPGNRNQLGKLIGLGRREIVIELTNDLRMHFPRIGYVVNKAE